MTRNTRMILVMGLIAAGGVVSLAWMAQRYGDVLTRRDAAPRSASAEELPDADADRLVEAYLRVRMSLAEVRTHAPGAAGDPGVALGEAIAAEGLAPEQYQELDAMHRAWRSDSPEVPEAYRAAFERRRHRLDETAADGGPAGSGS